MSERWPRIIAHLDMDAFYASVEQRDRPELRGKPVIVGGDGRRGVVATASYEARRYGVRSAMPGFRARELCPDGIFVAPRMDQYAEVSRQLMEILGRYSPRVEPLSLDEAFVDMTGAERIFGAPAQMGEAIRSDVRRELLLTASVGVATSKFVAKVASDFRKPDGLTVVGPGQERPFLSPLPVERLWGVGPKTAERVRAVGFRTIGDVAADPARVVAELGELGEHLVALAQGDDLREVEPDRDRKSLGAERTLLHDIRGRAAIESRLRPLCDEVAASLRAAGLRARGVRLKLKYATFRQVTRELRLSSAVADSLSLFAGLSELLSRLDLESPIRLVGVTAFELAGDEEPRQLGLFGVETGESSRRERLERAMDDVARRFGVTLVRRGGPEAGSGLDGTGGAVRVGGGRGKREPSE